MKRTLRIKRVSVLCKENGKSPSTDLHVPVFKKPSPNFKKEKENTNCSTGTKVFGATFNWSIAYPMCPRLYINRSPLLDEKKAHVSF